MYFIISGQMFYFSFFLNNQNTRLFRTHSLLTFVSSWVRLLWDDQRRGVPAQAGLLPGWPGRLAGLCQWNPLLQAQQPQPPSAPTHPRAHHHQQGHAGGIQGGGGQKLIITILYDGFISCIVLTVLRSRPPLGCSGSGYCSYKSTNLIFLIR